MAKKGVKSPHKVWVVMEGGVACQDDTGRLFVYEQGYYPKVRKQAVLAAVVRCGGGFGSKTLKAKEVEW